MKGICGLFFLGGKNAGTRAHWGLIWEAQPHAVTELEALWAGRPSTPQSGPPGHLALCWSHGGVPSGHRPTCEHEATSLSKSSSTRHSAVLNRQHG